MFVPSAQAQIWLCTAPTDMRKSFDGLSALVKHRLASDPLSGHYFVFVNRRKTQIKVLYFDPAGYCVWSHRLEQGQFPMPVSAADCTPLSPAQWQWLIDGIEVQKYRQFKRFGRAFSAAIG